MGYSGRTACDGNLTYWTRNWERMYSQGGRLHQGVAAEPLAPAAEFRKEYATDGPCWKCLIEAPLSQIGDDNSGHVWGRSVIRAILRGAQEDVRRKDVSARQLAVWIDRGVDRCVELMEAL